MFIRTNSTVLQVTERTHIMGILNITPDSFSDGGQYDGVMKAVAHAKEMERAGADIIDVGGESTRPDHAPVTAEIEIERVVPIIEALKKEITIPISIDTYKAATAEAAIQAGAEIINDIWGAKHDAQMAHVAAKYDVPIILMHNRSNKVYHSLMKEMVEDIEESIRIVTDAGVKQDKIIIDPGIGFGKELVDNYIVMNELDRLIAQLPYPLLLGASRKSFIANVLPIRAADRDNATAATTCLGIARGAHIIRVHDVERNVELAKMMDAMLRGVGIDG